MTTEPETDPELEIGHVLFMDIVGFSKLLVDKQSEASRRLNQIVRNTDQFRAAETEDKLFRLPTGDGMVLVFFNSPEAPARCAVEIARALKDGADFGLRMGIHSGPVHKISDVNDRSNLAGGGINIAQRVMDCGDAGHILLSQRVAEDLEQHSKWRPHLQDLGECEVKHGMRVNVVNLYTDEVGNSAVPEKVARAKQEQDAAVGAKAGAGAASRDVARRDERSYSGWLLLCHTRDRHRRLGLFSTKIDHGKQPNRIAGREAARQSFRGCEQKLLRRWNDRRIDHQAIADRRAEESHIAVHHDEIQAIARSRVRR